MEPLIQIKQHVDSTRDLRAEVLTLAIRAQDAARSPLRLVILNSRMSATRLRSEWEACIGVLDGDVRAKLRLSAVAAGGERVVFPEGDAGPVGFTSPSVARVKRVDRSMEVLKILLYRWLFRLGSLPVQDLQQRTGLTYPTVAKQLLTLGASVARSSNRSVALQSFPQTPWSELLVMAPRLRQTMMYTDTSGRPPDIAYLSRRLAGLRAESVVVGGVLGARHHHPGIDMVGVPRLDLCVHAPDGRMNTEFIPALDPALALTPHPHEAHVVVHAIHRSSFSPVGTPDAGGWADPVEVLMDLHDLRLFEQADALIHHLREGA